MGKSLNAWRACVVEENNYMFTFQPFLKEERIYRLQDFPSRNGEEEGACTGENKGSIKYPSSSMKQDKSMAYKVQVSMI